MLVSITLNWKLVFLETILDSDRVNARMSPDTVDANPLGADSIYRSEKSQLTRHAKTRLLDSGDISAPTVLTRRAANLLLFKAAQNQDDVAWCGR